MNHFAPLRFGDSRLVAGARHDAPIELIFDIDAILKDSTINLFWTVSWAICCQEIVPASYLLRAINVHTGFVVYDRNAVIDKEAKPEALGNEEQNTVEVDNIESKATSPNQNPQAETAVRESVADENE